MYEEHLREVDEVQARQRQALECWVSSHGLKAVYIESLTAQNADEFARQLSTLSKVRLTSNPRTPIEQFIADEYRLDLLRIGAAGRLAMDGTLQALPVEDAVAYTAANPLADGTYEVDLEAQEAREDAVIRNLAKGPAVAVLVLATPTITTCVGWLPGANWLRFGFGVTRSRPRAALVRKKFSRPAVPDFAMS